MPFPTTPVLDSFNVGALQGLSTRAGWSATDHPGGLGDLTTDAVPTYCAGFNCSNSWGTAALNPEVWFTIAALPNPNIAMAYARWQSGPVTGYRLALYNSPSFLLQTASFVTGTGAQLTNDSVAAAVGDSFGMSVIGSQVTSWYKAAAGSWTQVNTIVDTAVSASGLIAIHSNDSALRFDEFGGGETVTSEVSGPRPQAVPFTRGAGGGGRI